MQHGVEIRQLWLADLLPEPSLPSLVIETPEPSNIRPEGNFTIEHSTMSCEHLDSIHGLVITA